MIRRHYFISIEWVYDGKVIGKKWAVFCRSSWLADDPGSVVERAVKQMSDQGSRNHCIPNVVAFNRV